MEDYASYQVLVCTLYVVSRTFTTKAVLTVPFFGTSLRTVCWTVGRYLLWYNAVRAMELHGDTTALKEAPLTASAEHSAGRRAE
jgi:hypothetical protein